PRLLLAALTPAATTENHALSLHDALPISSDNEPGCKMSHLRFLYAGQDRASALEGGYDYGLVTVSVLLAVLAAYAALNLTGRMTDRKSTRLNSSHVKISYAVFCLKKKSRR